MANVSHRTVWLNIYLNCCWPIRRYHEFYVLDQKLQEFHGKNSLTYLEILTLCVVAVSLNCFVCSLLAASASNCSLTSVTLEDVINKMLANSRWPVYAAVTSVWHCYAHFGRLFHRHISEWKKTLAQLLWSFSNVLVAVQLARFNLVTAWPQLKLLALVASLSDIIISNEWQRCDTVYDLLWVRCGWRSRTVE